MTIKDENFDKEQYNNFLWSDIWKKVMDNIKQDSQLV